MPAISRQRFFQMWMEWHEVRICVEKGGGNVLQSWFLLQELQHDVQKTREAFLQNSILLDRLPQPAESNTHMLLAGQLHSLQRASYLERMLLLKTNEFEVHLGFPFLAIAHSLQFPVP